MKKKLTVRNCIIGLLLFLLLSQLIRIDKTNPTVDPAVDFISLTASPADVAAVLRTSCYDCHSNEARYPWYTNIAPFSWWIKHHINEGRGHLNFSVWGTYKPKRAAHKLEECVEQVEEDEMPMSSYTWMHHDASLSDQQRLLLMNFFKSVREKSGTGPQARENGH
ncbi:MAG: heme-binding domain-containing protein [Bacteroidia bacterium]